MLTLISIHIPKTAGTNFTEVLKTLHGEAIHFDYGTERNLQDARSCSPEILANTKAFRDRTAAIHGHFHYLKYKDVFPDVPVIATLRHPVARVISQYRHIALHGDPKVERHRRIMEGEMTVVRFAKFPFIGNAQSAFLEGIKVEDLDHAIIQEHFGATVRSFCQKAGHGQASKTIEALIGRSINARSGEAWATKAIPIADNDAKRIAQFCDKDLDIYDRALKKFVKA
jgi:hypothetical protein